KAMEAAEVFTVTKPFNEYHYTLYYYDQAGNLVKTVPPAGVVLLNNTQIDSVGDHRSNPDLSPVYPKDSLVSRYWFSTLDVPVKQCTPDGDSSRFWYDRLGRIAVNQSARQRPLNQFSYTLYDQLGRVIEVGELTQPSPMTTLTSKSPPALGSWISAVQHEQVTHTFYDAPPLTIIQFPQSNLRNRIACITSEDKSDGNAATYQSAIYYSYDIAGNVKAMMYDIAELATFKERY